MDRRQHEEKDLLKYSNWWTTRLETSPWLVPGLVPGLVPWLVPWLGTLALSSQIREIAVWPIAFQRTSV